VASPSSTYTLNLAARHIYSTGDAAFYNYITMSKINSLWYSPSIQDWNNAIVNYWNYVKPENLALEKELNELKLEQIIELDSIGWYKFLHNKYFRWKFTSDFLYAMATKSLKKYFELNQLTDLHSIKHKLLHLDLLDIKTSLLIATQIRGLGVAGASGLLSLMYPDSFATVDQFVVGALQLINDLPENKLLLKMNPKSISLNDGVILISIMRRKAKENNNIFHKDFWTPRKIDMVLWGARE
jgi:hypothetical protein